MKQIVFFQGNLIAVHRKVHLFDIDIPGKIKFKVSDNLSASTALYVNLQESETLTGGNTINFFDTGLVTKLFVFALLFIRGHDRLRPNRAGHML